MEKPQMIVSDNKIKYFIDHSTTVDENIHIIIGWCVFNSDKINEIKITYENGIAIDDLSICFGFRADVISHFKLKDEHSNCGFVLIFKKPQKYKSGKYKIIFKNDFETTETTVDVEKKEKLKDVLNRVITFSEEQIKNIHIALRSKQDKYTILLSENKTISQEEAKLRFYIDKAIYLTTGIFVTGWLDDLTIKIQGLYVNNAGELSANLIQKIARRERLDVNAAFPDMPALYKAGFYCFFPLPLRECNEDYIIVFELENKQLVTIPFKCQTNSTEVEASEFVLSNFNPFKDDILSIFENHVSYALKDIWKDKQNLNLENLRIKQFGTLKKPAKYSIIVPIYGRIDFVMFQLSQFADDLDFEETELIYVLDDPRLESVFFEYCNTLSEIYIIPFKIVFNYKNNGFGGANNIGVHVATGEKLILLNSDVMPSEKGWVSKMADTYDSLEKPGVLGVKLVYEDESIQHLGMNFYMHKIFKIYMNEHPGKGLPESFNEKFDVKKVNAATAACVMITKKLFQSFGGFNLDYILGDFEDSDMCLKLISLGYNNYITSQVKMYHLERQSQNLVPQGGDWKFKLTLYNGWQQYKKWNSLIEKLLKK